MNTEGNLALLAFARELRGQSIGLAATFEEIKASGEAIPPETFHRMEWIVSLAEAALRENATAFEAVPDEAARKQMLELDDALRSQLKTLKKLLELPRR